MTKSVFIRMITINQQENIATNLFEIAKIKTELSLATLREGMPTRSHNLPCCTNHYFCFPLHFCLVSLTGAQRE
jgi:hypothetical protein